MATSLQNDGTVEDGKKGDVNQDLSSHLYEILEVVGVNEVMRQRYRENAMVIEILQHTKAILYEDGDKFLYVFGSRCEGTTTPGLSSDLDLLSCFEDVPVVENIKDAPLDGKSLLLVHGETKPGYVKLQALMNGTKLTIQQKGMTRQMHTDNHGRLLLKHYHTPIPNAERHGPADFTPRNSTELETDHVAALKCKNIPSFADEWLHRHRPYQWPSQEQIHKMGSYGCFFVGVGHPNSHKKEIEWRVSFSLQERELMFNLNPTQHKCYVLLKMIKNDIIQPRVGKSLSSYHCKTCIFHLVESSGVDQWTPNNLVPRMIECLRLLLYWARQENCPNYFIKEENMFDRLEESTLIELTLVLQELSSSNGVQFLYEITCDGFGQLLRLNGSDRQIEKKRLAVERHFGYDFYIHMIKKLLSHRNDLCRSIDNQTVRGGRIARTYHMLRYMEITPDLTHHDTRDVRTILDRFTPYIRLVFLQMILNDKRSHNEMKFAFQGVQCLKDCDLISSRLVNASYYLQIDKLDSCRKMIQSCVASFKPQPISICSCYYHPYSRNIALEEKIVAEKLSFENFQRKCTTSCMVFLPSEANLVPAALRYEMFRSVYTPPGSRDERDDCWYDWIVVNSKVYLYFLQYILCAKTNELVYKQDAIDRLRHLIDTDYNLGHIETALNLLGWIYMQENRVNDAFDCFRRSLAVLPLHNAAKWHLLMLIHSKISTEIIYNRKWFQ